MATLRLYIINAFTPAPPRSALGGGNPAAVILLSANGSGSLSDGSRQALAAELNLSETAFVTREGCGSLSLRWFTPVTEVALCGHATLAAGHAVMSEGWVAADATVEFATRRSGTLRVATAGGDGGEGKGEGAWAGRRLAMRLPLLTRRDELGRAEKEAVVKALRMRGEDVLCAFRSEYDVVVQTAGAGAVRATRPDMRLVAGLETRGVAVTAREGSDGGFVSRFFAPQTGIEEDAATGSAHCALAGAFLEEGETVQARQVSRRGGEMTVGRDDGEAVLTAWVATVVRGEVVRPGEEEEEEEEEEKEGESA